MARSVARILRDATSAHRSYKRLVTLCDRHGHRLTGSKSLEAAIDWSLDTMRKEGFANVHREKVVAPHWVRGEESATLISPHIKGKESLSLVMLGLGMSVGTPAEGLTADVIVVRDERELQAARGKVKGKIVVFNNPMPQWTEEKGACYGKTVRFRVKGPDMAAKLGAVAVLVRSVTAHSLRTPHTGMTFYKGDTIKIPAAAITTEDADLLQRLQEAGKTPRVVLKMGAKRLPDTVSGNAVAELLGREKPDEIVIVSGHIDSWDTGQGAHDDGTGVVMAMETLAILKRLNVRPRRTVRMVLWTNEENGMAGAKSYARDHKAELAKHAAAVEADFGGFNPRAFGLAIHDKPRQAKATEQLRKWMAWFKPVGNLQVKAGWSAPDVSKLTAHGVPTVGLYTHGQRYFDYHHTHADTVDKVDPNELARSTGALAALVYLLAESPGHIGE